MENLSQKNKEYKTPKFLSSHLFLFSVCVLGVLCVCVIAGMCHSTWVKSRGQSSSLGESWRLNSEGRAR